MRANQSDAEFVNELASRTSGEKQKRLLAIAQRLGGDGEVATPAQAEAADDQDLDKQEAAAARFLKRKALALLTKVDLEKILESYVAGAGNRNDHRGVEVWVSGEDLAKLLDRTASAITERSAESSKGPQSGTVQLVGMVERADAEAYAFAAARIDKDARYLLDVHTITALHRHAQYARDMWAPEPRGAGVVRSAD